jgi:hypothetical protein
MAHRCHLPQIHDHLQDKTLNTSSHIRNCPTQRTLYLADIATIKFATSPPPSRHQPIFVPFDPATALYHQRCMQLPQKSKRQNERQYQSRRLVPPHDQIKEHTRQSSQTKTTAKRDIRRELRKRSIQTTNLNHRLTTKLCRTPHVESSGRSQFKRNTTQSSRTKPRLSSLGQRIEKSSRVNGFSSTRRMNSVGSID